MLMMNIFLKSDSLISVTKERINIYYNDEHFTKKYLQIEFKKDGINACLK